MFAFAARRLLQTIPLFLIASLAIFWVVNETGDPRDRLATCAQCDASAYERLETLYELDKPIITRWASWLGNAATGDLGTALSLGERPVSEILPDKIGNTVMLAIPAFLLTIVVATAISIWSALRQYKFDDYALTGIAFLGIALPTFVFGLALQSLMIWLQQTYDIKPLFVLGKHSESWGALVQSLVLPVITLAFITIGGESRFGRSAMLEIINADYIRTARAKGLAERTVIFKHALRNALVVFVTIWALDFAALLGGAVVTETVFNWPGMGSALLGAIFAQDIHLTMGIVFFISLLAIGFNLLADLLYGLIDPRIRYD